MVTYTDNAIPEKSLGRQIFEMLEHCDSASKKQALKEAELMINESFEARICAIKDEAEIIQKEWDAFKN